MPLKKFYERIDHCLLFCDHKRYITLDSFSQQFPEPEWEGMTIAKSPLNKIFQSDAFRVTSEGNSTRIDANHLKLFGLLHCVGHVKEKATFLFNIINSAETPQDNLETIFEKICALASWELFGMVANSDKDLEFYTTKDI